LFDSYIQGFFLGLGAAVPLGPINILIMNHALKNYRFGVAIGFGAMSADIFYLLLVLIGVLNFLHDPTFLNVLGVLGSFFLLYMGIGIFRSRNKKLNKGEERIRTKDILKLYSQGFVLTLLNPYTIAFWASIAGYTVHKELDILFTIVGMISALLLWITIMPYFISRAKHKIGQKTSFYINIVSSIILVGFGFSLLFNVVL
jgi:L-lysine exporter family protein LysE/ArgO